MAHTALIVGGGKVGGAVATLLLQGDHTVRVVESRADHAASLEARLGPGIVHRGSGTDAAVLEAAGIRTSDVVAAVTGADETNLVVCSLARFEFQIKRTIARVVDPRNAWMFQRDMGVDAALDQADLLAHLIAEEMSLGEMTTLLKLQRGDWSVVEERVGGASPVAGHTVSGLQLPDRCVLLAILRSGDVVVPRGDVVVRAGDEVVALVHRDDLAHLERALGRISS